MRLGGKVAVITGAGRGVGRSTALAYAREGARLVLAARTVSEIEAVAAEIRARGGEAIAVPTDVGRSADVWRLRDAALAAFGQIDVLVNNAAVIVPGGPVWEIDPDEWMQTQNINLGGYVRTCRAVLPHMIERRRGKIINVSSGAGIHTMPHWSAYAVSKAAIIHFTRCLADEVMPYGINVNAVGVHAVTRLWHEQIAWGPSGGQHPIKLKAMIESGRVPLAEENDGALVFLASSDADHVTGEYFSANGLPAAFATLR